MLCPVCKTVELRMAERQGIEIDYCPECRGVWLDRGELDKIIDRSAAELSAAQQPQQSAPQPPAAPPPPQPGYAPPPQPGYAPPPPPVAGPAGGYRRDPDSDYDEHYGRHGHGQYYQKKKRKSLLGELFDFD